MYICIYIFSKMDPLPPYTMSAMDISNSWVACCFFRFYSSDTFLPRQVYNVIPSISAITGVTPQTYMWRIAVAFHVGPRMVIAQVYYNYFINQMSKAADKSTTYILINLCYWLNLIEIAAICGVTYISNRENYRGYPSLFLLLFNLLSFNKNHPYVLSFSRAWEDLHFVHAQLIVVHDRYD